MSAPTRGLTAEQLDLLLRSISPNRVQQHQGQAHLEAFDVRRWLTRVFGFGGWSDEIIALDMVHQSIWPVTDNKGEPVPGKHRATVVYRVTLRLIVKDVHGNVLNAWDDVATGEAVNQPTVGDAHDLAIKAAVSQALKRCAVNLGDQFGLSLYNDGSVEPVIVATFGHPDVGRPTEAQPVPEDAPVVGGDLAEQAPAEGEKGLHSMKTPGDEQHAPEQPAPEQQAQPDRSFWETGDGKHLLKVLHTLIFRKYGPRTDEERHAAFSKFTGRQVTSAKQLTQDEAELFIAALRTQPDYVKPKPAPKQAADGNENFRHAEALLRLERQQESQELEQDLRDDIESAASPNDLAAAMTMTVALRDEGRLTGEQFARLAAAADERAARARKQLAAAPR